MAISLGGITVTGRVSLSKLNTDPEIFEGTNLTLVLPVSFAGSDSTFTSTNDSALLPVSFSVDPSSIFTATTNSELPVSFVGS